MLIEIATFSIEAAIAAQSAGADRIELCSAPAEGGLTPGLGTIRVARRHLTVPINVMIRPREGDFCYSGREFDCMLLDIETCASEGVNGIVTGILLKEGTIDLERMKLIVETAGPMKVTFHRAFDMVLNQYEAMETLIEMGIATILTSGGQQTAMQGLGRIADLVIKAENRIDIMPGSGINDLNSKELVEKTGVSEIHLSARSFVAGAMKYKNTDVSMGGKMESAEYELLMPDVGMIRRIKGQLTGIN